MSIIEYILYGIIGALILWVIIDFIIKEIKIHKMKKSGMTYEEIKEALKKKKGYDEEE